MKLSDVKEKIDDFFDRTTPQELYDLSLRYGFQEIGDKDEETMHNSETFSFYSEDKEKEKDVLVIA
jgi:hypothetical protein